MEFFPCDNFSRLYFCLYSWLENVVFPTFLRIYLFRGKHDSIHFCFAHFWSPKYLYDAKGGRGGRGGMVVASQWCCYNLGLWKHKYTHLCGERLLIIGTINESSTGQFWTLTLSFTYHSSSYLCHHQEIIAIKDFIMAYGTQAQTNQTYFHSKLLIYGRRSLEAEGQHLLE